MARKKSQTLTDGELRIMDVIWDLGEASVRDVTDRLRQREDVAYNTVQTMLRILEDKGVVQHERRGRAFIYTALVDRQAASQTALRHLLSGFFKGSPKALVANLLEDDSIDALEIERLKAMIRDADGE